MQLSATCYRKMCRKFWESRGSSSIGFSLWGIALQGLTLQVETCATSQIAGLPPGDVGHGTLVLAEQFLPELRGEARVRRFIWRDTALLDRLFQTCQKRLTWLAAIHVFFELFTKGIVQFIVEVAGEFGEHFLATPLTGFLRKRSARHHRLLVMVQNMPFSKFFAHE